MAVVFTELDWMEAGGGGQDQVARIMVAGGGGQVRVARFLITVV